MLTFVFKINVIELDIMNILFEGYLKFTAVQYSKSVHDNVSQHLNSALYNGDNFIPPYVSITTFSVFR